MCECRKKVFAVLRPDVPQLLQPSTEEETFSCKYNAHRAFILWNSLHCPSSSAMLALGCNSDRTLLQLCSLLKSSVPWVDVNSSLHKSLSKPPLSQVSQWPLSIWCTPPPALLIILLSYFELVSPLQNNATVECGLVTLEYFMFYLFKWIFFPKLWPDYWYIAIKCPKNDVLIVLGPWAPQ